MMAFGQMGWNPMYQGYAGYAQQAMPDQLAQLRAQQQFNPQMSMQTPVQQQGQQGAPIWVQGEAGAKSFLVAPGQSLVLMDSEAEVFYIKATDASGVPLPLRTFDYKERATGTQRPVQAAQTPQADYVTRAEFEALAARFAELTAKPAPQHEPVQPQRRRQQREVEGVIDA